MSIKVDVGTPPESYKEWTTVLVRFHGFANLTTTRGEDVQSPYFSCLGHQWRLDIYPGGRANSEEGYAGIKLAKRSNESIEIQWGYSIRNSDGEEVVTHSRKNEFAAPGSDDGYSAWCARNLAKRSYLME